MHEKRTHDENTAPLNRTGDRLDACRGRMYLLVSEHAKVVSPRKHTQRPIVFSRSVEVNTQSDYL